MSTSFSDARNGRKSCSMRQSTSMYSTSSPVINSVLPARSRSSSTRASGERRRDAPLRQCARHRPIHRQDDIVVHTLPVCVRNPVGGQLSVRVIAGCEQHEVLALHALSHRHERLVPGDRIRRVRQRQQGAVALMLAIAAGKLRRGVRPTAQRPLAEGSGGAVSSFWHYCGLVQDVSTARANRCWNGGPASLISRQSDKRGGALTGCLRLGAHTRALAASQCLYS
eukprot:6141463-Prymnesium_polylepis.1